MIALWTAELMEPDGAPMVGPSPLPPGATYSTLAGSGGGGTQPDMASARSEAAKSTPAKSAPAKSTPAKSAPDRSAAGSSRSAGGDGRSDAAERSSKGRS